MIHRVTVEDYGVDGNKLLQVHGMPTEKCRLVPFFILCSTSLYKIKPKEHKTVLRISILLFLSFLLLYSHGQATIVVRFITQDMIDRFIVVTHLTPRVTSSSLFGCYFCWPMQTNLYRINTCRIIL